MLQILIPNENMLKCIRDRMKSKVPVSTKRNKEQLHKSCLYKREYQLQRNIQKPVRNQDVYSQEIYIHWCDYSHTKLSGFRNQVCYKTWHYMGTFRHIRSLENTCFVQSLYCKQSKSTK